MTDTTVAQALRDEGYEVCVGENAMWVDGPFRARVLSNRDGTLFVALYWDGLDEHGVRGRSVYLGHTATLDQIVEVARAFRRQCDPGGAA